LVVTGAGVSAGVIGAGVSAGVTGVSLGVTWIVAGVGVGAGLLFVLEHPDAATINATTNNIAI
jgi:hypothetical protein